ncbi:MAG: lytic murein transglycosylase [Pseudomonadota bacterium]|nr:lytic murein transglycosylase [Pseudomonadota bacterium]
MKGRERRRRRNGWEAVLPGALLLAMTLLMPFPAAGEWGPLERKLGADGFDGTEVAALFQRADLRFDPTPMRTKIIELLGRAHRGDTGRRKVDRKTVYGRYLRPETLRSAHAYLERHQELLGRIGRKYCVPREIVVAIVLVETNLGANTGGRRAFDVLASMALADDLEKVRPFLPPGVVHEGNEEEARRRCREKAAWAYRELKDLLKYSRSAGVDPLTIPGSIYGAIGLCQFMPSNIFLYGVDGDGDGGIDIFTVPDALHSIGNYLHRHGWTCRMDGSRRRRVVMAYNRSQVYANTVLAVADRLRAMDHGKKRRR